jgi:hypothetical protein
MKAVVDGAAEERRTVSLKLYEVPELIREGYSGERMFQPSHLTLGWRRAVGDADWKLDSAMTSGRSVKKDGTPGKQMLRRGFCVSRRAVLVEDAPQWLRSLVEEHSPAAMAAEVDSQVVGP